MSTSPNPAPAAPFPDREPGSATCWRCNMRHYGAPREQAACVFCGAPWGIVPPREETPK